MNTPIKALGAALLSLFLLTGTALAAGNAHYGDLRFAEHCDGVVIFGQLDEESDREFGYEVYSGAKLVATGLIDVPEDGAFKVSLALPAGDYALRWDDERVDSSYQSERFSVPECNETPPPSDRPVSSDRPRMTLPPTDTVSDAVNVAYSEPLIFVGILLLGISAVGFAVQARRR